MTDYTLDLEYDCDIDMFDLTDFDITYEKTSHASDSIVIDTLGRILTYHDEYIANHGQYPERIAEALNTGKTILEAHTDLMNDIKQALKYIDDVLNRNILPYVAILTWQQDGVERSDSCCFQAASGDTEYLIQIFHDLAENNNLSELVGDENYLGAIYDLADSAF